MNDHAQKWVEALRSGKVEQGKGGLRRREDRFCCLGVACEVYRRETGDGKWLPTADGDWLPFEAGGYEMVGEMPHVVRNWLGLKDGSGSYGPRSRSLARQNDGGVTFEEIAAIIESEPDGLFQGETA